MRLAIVIGFIASSVFASAAVADGNMTPKNAHSFTLTSISGEAMPLSAYKGKVVLLVNTASKCSFTRQYDPLQALHERYGDAGLVIVGVPSNDFGRQEPGTEDDIAKFVSGEYHVSFPMAAKSDVTGSDANPLYQWLASEAGPLGVPRWNFHKYLIGPDGEMIDWFTSITEPDSPKLIAAIEKALQSRVSAKN